LVYSKGGKVFLRDTISVGDTSGLVRYYDTTVNASVTYGYLTDPRDGRIYRTLLLGDQTWMAQNLDFAVDSSWWYVGYTSPLARDSNPDPKNHGATHGRLYTWPAALGLSDTCETKYCNTPDSCRSKTCPASVFMRRQGPCPNGWHIPREAEWRKLTDTLLDSATSRTILKSVYEWYMFYNKSCAGTDSLGFRAQPGGYYGRQSGHPFVEMSEDGRWWTATEDGYWNAKYEFLDYAMNTSTIQSFYKDSGLSIRCVKD
jgi:uncharacterized protein (TIGR02145 family)